MNGTRPLACAAIALAIVVSVAPAATSASGARFAAKAIHPGVTPNAASAPYLHSKLTPGGVITKPKVYLVFWGKQWANDPADARPDALTAFFSHLYGPADTWGMVLDQYCQGLPAHTIKCGNGGQHVIHPNSTPLGGAWLDNSTNTPSTATHAQLASEATKAAQHFGNTTQAKNSNAIYMVASPHGTHPDRFPSSGFCAWHGVVQTSAGMLTFANIPYVPDVTADNCTTLEPAAPLDGYFSSVSHEYAESVTNPWLTRGWFDNQGSELADRCVNLDRRETLGGTKYDVQGVWSNLTMSCRV